MCFDSHGDIIHISLYCWSILFNIFLSKQEILQNSSKFENKKLDNMAILKKRQFFNRRDLISLFPFIIIDLDHLHTHFKFHWRKNRDLTEAQLWTASTKGDPYVVSLLGLYLKKLNKVTFYFFLTI